MGETKQPVWKLIAQLGDANPIEYGGYFVYVDETGIYPPEGEKLFAPPEDAQEGSAAYRWEVRRFILENLKQVKHGEEESALLISARYDETWPHPIESYDEWFSKDLESIGGYLGGMDAQYVRDLFCSDNPIDRARAWEALGDYHGYDNLDSYPLRLTEAEVNARYATRGGLKPVNLATLTEDENARWEDLFQHYANTPGVTPDGADELTWQDMLKEFPRLKDFDGCKP